VVKIRGGCYAEWDYLRGLKEGWIPTLPATNVTAEEYFGSCYDIMERTTHEVWFDRQIEDFDDAVLSDGETLVVGQDGHWIPKRFANGVGMDDERSTDDLTNAHEMNGASIFFGAAIVIVVFSLILKKIRKSENNKYSEINDI